MLLQLRARLAFRQIADARVQHLNSCRDTAPHLPLHRLWRRVRGDRGWSRERRYRNLGIGQRRLSELDERNG